MAVAKVCREELVETCARDSTPEACYTTYLKGKDEMAHDFTRFDACKFELQSIEYRFHFLTASYA